MLLGDVCEPTDAPPKGEHRRERLRRETQPVEQERGVELDVGLEGTTGFELGEGLEHGALVDLGFFEERRARQERPSRGSQHVGSRITNTVDAVTKPHDASTFGQLSTHPFARVRIQIARSRPELEERAQSRTRSPSVQRAFQSAQSRFDGTHPVRPSADDDSRGEGRGIHAVIDHRVEIGLERPHLLGRAWGSVTNLEHPTRETRGIARSALRPSSRAQPLVDRNDDPHRPHDALRGGLAFETQGRDRESQRIDGGRLCPRRPLQHAQRESIEAALLGPRSSQGGFLRLVRQAIVGHQERHRLERAGRSNIRHIVPGERQPPLLTIDVTQTRLRRDHAVQPFRAIVHRLGHPALHVLTLALAQYVVNIDNAINMSSHVSSREAAQMLGVGRSTVYAYVSRGLIRSRPVAGTRRHEYAKADVEALVQRKQARRDPGAAVVEALDVRGMPVLSSGITLIQNGRLFYRGRDVLSLTDDALAGRLTFEDVAALLWGETDFEHSPEAPKAPLRRHLDALPPIEALQSWLAAVGPHDPAAHSLHPPVVRAAASRMLQGMAAVAARSWPPGESVAATLAQGWSCTSTKARRKLDAALIACADHELNVSTFTARCVASSGSTVYMAVTAALAALRGFRHGGHTERIAEMLEDEGAPREVLSARLRRGAALPGFGHPLYPDGDPRGRLVMGLATGRGCRRAHALAQAVQEMLGLQPNLDYALVALSRSLQLPREAPLVLFALGRCAGWVAHVLEQYEGGTMIRPRADYRGPLP